MTPEQLQRVGERVCNLKKAYNIREGWTRADDWLPDRVFEDPLPTGVAKGVLLSREELAEMIDGYYEARGWTARRPDPGGQAGGAWPGRLAGRGVARRRRPRRRWNGAAEGGTDVGPRAPNTYSQLSFWG